MPKKYEEIRDALVAQGKPLKEAESEAARTYNAERKPGQAPVGPQSDAASHQKGRKRS